MSSGEIHQLIHPPHPEGDNISSLICDLQSLLLGKNWNDLSVRIQGKLPELGKTLSLLIKKEIYEDGIRTSKGYKDTLLLKSVNCSLWLYERNTLPRSFVRGSSGAEIRNENEKSLALSLIRLNRYIMLCFFCVIIMTDADVSW